MKKYREIVTRLLVTIFRRFDLEKILSRYEKECRSTDNRPTRLIQEGEGKKERKGRMKRVENEFVNAPIDTMITRELQKFNGEH